LATCGYKIGSIDVLSAVAVLVAGAVTFFRVLLRAKMRVR